MALTHEALQAHVDHLDAAVDELLASEGDRFLVVFAGHLYALADLAAPSDLPWLRNQARDMLERRRLVSPAEGEG
ncbi:hypothetical protein D3C81_2278610 [compost metagenome]